MIVLWKLQQQSEVNGTEKNLLKTHSKFNRV